MTRQESILESKKTEKPLTIERHSTVTRVENKAHANDFERNAPKDFHVAIGNREANKKRKEIERLHGVTIDAGYQTPIRLTLTSLKWT